MDLHKKKYTIVDGFRCNRRDRVMKPTVNSKIGFYIKRQQSILDIISYERNHFDYSGLILLPDNYVSEFSEKAYDYVTNYRHKTSPKYRIIFDPHANYSYADLLKKYVTPKNIARVIKSDLQLLIEAQYSVKHYIIIADYHPTISLKHQSVDNQFTIPVNLTLISKNKKDRKYCNSNKLGIKDLSTKQKRDMLKYNVPVKKIFGNHSLGFTKKELDTWWNTYEQISYPKPTLHQSFFLKMDLVNYLNARFLRDCTILADTYNDMDNYAQITSTKDFDMTRIIQERIDEARE